MVWQVRATYNHKQKNRQACVLSLSPKTGHLCPNACSLCATVAESCNHLFLHYSMASQIWEYFLLHFRRPWVMQYSMFAVIYEWSQTSGIGISTKGNFIWRFLPFVICWDLWSEVKVTSTLLRAFLGPYPSYRRVYWSCFSVGFFICQCSKALDFIIGRLIGMM